MPLLGTSEALKIIKNGLEMRNLWPPKVGGVKNSKQQPQPVIEYPKKSFYVALLLL